MNCLRCHHSLPYFSAYPALGDGITCKHCGAKHVYSADLSFGLGFQLGALALLFVLTIIASASAWLAIPCFAIGAYFLQKYLQDWLRIDDRV